MTTMTTTTLSTVFCAAVFLLISAPTFARSCDTDADCEDGLFCNGTEFCWLGRVCRTVPFSNPCLFGGQICIESTEQCVTPCDVDSDCPGDEVCNGAVCIPTCSDDSYCDDGLFCNGIEACIPGHEEADYVGCVRSNPPCLEGYICQEAEDSCVSECPFVMDGDGDGFISIDCGGSDCDDSTAARNPGNPEVCDVDNIDEDCNPLTFGDRDSDGDGYIDEQCCNEQSDGVLICGDDCNDSLNRVHPLAAEICDLRDNDCNGHIDEDNLGYRYPDNDGDGFGDNVKPEVVQLCDGAPGFSENYFDCDDTNPAIVPGSMVCVVDGEPKVQICDANSSFISSECPSGTVCITMPNGLGECEPQCCFVADPL